MASSRSRKRSGGGGAAAAAAEPEVGAATLMFQGRDGVQVFVASRNQRERLGPDARGVCLISVPDPAHPKPRQQVVFPESDVHVPLGLHKHIDAASMEFVVQQCHSLLQAGARRLVVYCSAGMTRSPAVACALRMGLTGCTFDQARQHLVDMRAAQPKVWRTIIIKETQKMLQEPGRAARFAAGASCGEGSVAAAAAAAVAAVSAASSSSSSLSSGASSVSAGRAGTAGGDPKRTKLENEPTALSSAVAPRLAEATGGGGGGPVSGGDGALHGKVLAPACDRARAPCCAVHALAWLLLLQRILPCRFLVHSVLRQWDQCD
jgi:hypothetical protein